MQKISALIQWWYIVYLQLMILMGWCNKDVTPLLRQCNSFFLAPTHRYVMFTQKWSIIHDWFSLIFKHFDLKKMHFICKCGHFCWIMTSWSRSLMHINISRPRRVNNWPFWFWICNIGSRGGVLCWYLMPELPQLDASQCSIQLHCLRQSNSATQIDGGIYCLSTGMAQ